MMWDRPISSFSCVSYQLIRMSQCLRKSWSWSRPYNIHLDHDQPFHQSLSVIMPYISLPVCHLVSITASPAFLKPVRRLSWITYLVFQLRKSGTIGSCALMYIKEVSATVHLPPSHVYTSCSPTHIKLRSSRVWGWIFYPLKSTCWHSLDRITVQYLRRRAIRGDVKSMLRGDSGAREAHFEGIVWVQVSLGRIPHASLELSSVIKSISGVQDHREDCNFWTLWKNLSYLQRL